MPTANSVLNVLRAGPFREPAHVWLYELRNSTGYTRAVPRYADALVTSVWPTRGIWFAGIEVKVARGDWLRELDDPTKSAEIQRFCDYWWVAAPKGVVKKEEVPEQWGFYEIDGKKAKAVKQAPRLEPEPLDKSFVASIMRNASAGQEAIRRKVRDEMFLEYKDKLADANLQGLEQKINQLEHEKRTLEAQLKLKTFDFEQLKRHIAEVEKETGINFYMSGYARRFVGPQYKLATLLADMNPEVLAGHLEDAARGLRTLDNLKKGEPPTPAPSPASEEPHE